MGEAGLRAVRSGLTVERMVEEYAAVFHLCSRPEVRSTETDPLNVILLTNMYPTLERPWFGSFVAAQIEDLRALGVKMHLHSFDGTADRLNYVRAARDLRSLVGSRGFDLVHAHYGLTGAVAVSQRSLPVVTTFHGGDYTG